MGYARVCIQTAGDHLFWEQGVLRETGVQSQGLKVQTGDRGVPLPRVSPSLPRPHSPGSS